MDRPRCVDQLVIAGLIVVSTCLLIGDFGVRLANTSTDDGVVGYALFFQQPQLFRLDAQMTSWGPVALASMMNWLPGVALKYAGMSPELWYWLLVFLENVLLGLAVFRFSIVTSGSRPVAWLAALFVLAFRPHWWNIGLFADVDWMPYAAWVALPLLVYAAAYALEGRVYASAIALLAGGLLHPVHGLFATATIAGYWALVRLRGGTNRDLAVRACLLVVVTAVFSAPVIVAKSGIPEAPPSVLLPLLLNNFHTNPWASPGCSFCLPMFLRNLPVTLMVAALAVLAVRRANLRSGTGLLVAASIAVTLAASALHVAAYFLESVPLLRVIGTRSSVLLLIYCVPLMVALAWRMWLTAGPIVRMMAAYLLVLPSPAALLAAVPLFVSAEGVSSRTGRWCRILGTALFAFVLARHVPKLGPRIDLYLLAPLMDPGTIPFIFGYQTIQFPLYAKLIPLALAAMVAWLVIPANRGTRAAPAWLPAPAGRWAAGLLSVMIACYLLMWNRQSGALATRGEPREYFEVQAWARAATAADASFVVGYASQYEGWRNFTRRPAVTPHAICAVYHCPVSSVARDRRMKEFYARVDRPSYIALDAAGLREFARTFGGDYAVRRREWGVVDLPVAYQNDRYVVYDLR